MEPILEIRNLQTFFHTKSGEVQAVRGVDLSVQPGEAFGIVGESGCGKSVTAMSILRVLPEYAYHPSGEILYNGKNILTMNRQELRKIRGREIAMVFQDPMTCLSPLMKVGKQIDEALLQACPGMTRSEAREKTLSLLRQVHIPDPESRYHCYPHELSGGMRQRVMIAMALSASPRLLICDEPTTALDVTIQKQILLLLKEMCRSSNTAIIFITHDLGVVAELCDRVAVLYGGIKVEEGDAFSIYEHTAHPYTMGLLSSIPSIDRNRSIRLTSIPGSPPDLLKPPAGCPFAARCPHARRICLSSMPDLMHLTESHDSRCWLLHPDAPAENNPPV